MENIKCREIIIIFETTEESPDNEYLLRFNYESWIIKMKLNKWSNIERVKWPSTQAKTGHKYCY